MVTYEPSVNHRQVLFEPHGIGVVQAFYQLLKTLDFYENWEIWPLIAHDLGCHLATWSEFQQPLRLP